MPIPLQDKTLTLHQSIYNLYMKGSNQVNAEQEFVQSLPSLYPNDVPVSLFSYTLVLPGSYKPLKIKFKLVISNLLRNYRMRILNFQHVNLLLELFLHELSYHFQSQLYMLRGLYHILHAKHAKSAKFFLFRPVFSNFH